jgi:hypothetical protein
LRLDKLKRHAIHLAEAVEIASPRVDWTNGHRELVGRPDRFCSCCLSFSLHTHATLPLRPPHPRPPPRRYRGRRPLDRARPRTIGASRRSTRVEVGEPDPERHFGALGRVWHTGSMSNLQHVTVDRPALCIPRRMHTVPPWDAGFCFSGLTGLTKRLLSHLRKSRVGGSKIPSALVCHVWPSSVRRQCGDLPLPSTPRKPCFARTMKP